MRQIKFRAWDFENKQMRTELRASEIGMLVEGGYKGLMQFTGLLDKNGKEIYEGDIVENNGCNWQVTWKEGGVFIEILDAGKNGKWWISGENEYSEIIGNIYENPELLK